MFHGKVLGIRDLVSFESDNAKGLKAAFEEAIEDYLEVCAAEGKNPETPFKGVFNGRTRQDLHRRASIYAE